MKRLLYLILAASWSIFTTCNSRMIAENLKNLQKRIEFTCQNCGRNIEDVKLVAVSKTFSIDKIQETIDAGQLDFGENYVQELQEKQKALIHKPVRWHFIGHLQSNKVKYIAEYISLIHSVDDIDLGREINKRAQLCNRFQDVLVEVHTTSEKSKFGVKPEHTIALIKDLSRLPHIMVRGLMTMGPFADDPNLSRPSFQQLGELKKRVEVEGIENVEMRYLSMGMTHDFEVAIEEGATIIRIGSAIFGERSKKVN